MFAEEFALDVIINEINWGLIKRMVQNPMEKQKVIGWVIGGAMENGNYLAEDEWEEAV